MTYNKYLEKRKKGSTEYYNKTYTDHKSHTKVFVPKFKEKL